MRLARLRPLAVALAIAVAAPFAAGCVPTSKTPIGDPAKAKFDADIGGLWRVEVKPGEPPGFIAFAPRGEGGEQVEACMFGTKGGRKGLDMSLYRGVTTRAGERRFLSLEPLMFDSDPKDAARKGDEKGYFLLCYEVSDGKARVGLARLEPLVKAVEEGKLKGTVKKGQVPSVDLDDSPEALAAYFGAPERKVDEMFKMELNMVRVEAPAAGGK